MGKLGLFAKKSKLMDVTIRYGDEKFKFNLYKELVIDENIINDELKSASSPYAFLGLLHKKLIRLREDAEAEKDKAYASAIISWKSMINDDTNRVYSDDLAKQNTILDDDYQEKCLKYRETKENASIIESCLKSFEKRTDLVQSLNANLRKENHL